MIINYQSLSNLYIPLNHIQMSDDEYIYDSPINVACIAGDLERVKHHIEVCDAFVDEDTYFDTIRAGHLEILKYLDVNTEIETNTYSELKAIASTNNIEVVRYLVEEMGVCFDPYPIEKLNKHCKNDEIREYIHHLINWQLKS